MIFGIFKNWLYRKAKLRRRDLIFVAFFFGIFYISKNFILETYLKIASKSYSKNLVFEYKKYCKNDFEKALLIKENQELKNLLKLSSEKSEEKYMQNNKYIFAKVLTNIFAASPFWAVVRDSSNIKKLSKVWVYEFENEISYKRLIGFVDHVDGQYIKILPITHKKIRFIAQTVSGIGLLLKGNGRNIKIILSNVDKIPDNKLNDEKDLYHQQNLSGQIVILDNKVVGKIVSKNHVMFKNFANIKWICIEEHV